MHIQKELKCSNPHLMESGMSSVCPVHGGLRCLRPEQLFSGHLRAQQRCMTTALQLRRSLLSVLYLIPQCVINKALLITVGAVKDPLSSLLPTAAQQPYSLLLLSQKLSCRWDGDSHSISWTVLIPPHYHK